MNKLKNGVIMFFFVVAAYLALVNPLDRYFGGEDKLIMFFIIFGALILSFSFSFLLAKSEQKIKENNYSYGWLIKSNLLLSLLFYIALIIFSVILVFISIQFFNAQNESGLLVFIILWNGLWIAPLAVLIFNFIPSLLFYKFYSSKHFLKITPLAFVALSFILIAFFITRNTTCEFKRDYACVAEKAIKAENPQICEQIEENFAQGLCYEHVSRKINDVSLCDNISSETIQSICIKNIAVNMNDPKICEGVKSKEVGTDKESCYMWVQDKSSSN